MRLAVYAPDLGFALLSVLSARMSLTVVFSLLCVIMVVLLILLFELLMLILILQRLLNIAINPPVQIFF